MEWTEGIVRNKKVWAPGLFTLSIEAPEVHPFEPGQFLQLGYDRPDGHLHRPYSVASPHETTLEFFIVLVEQGQLTPWLWQLNPGDQIHVSKKPAGGFTLTKCPEATTIWLIGTGTGLAPYIAMLRRPEIWERYKKIVLVHGIRHASDQAYLEEIAGYSEGFGSQFVFVPVVSREQAAGALFGRITQCLVDGSLEAMAQCALTLDSCVMMCGNPDMLDEMERLLGERGLKKHRHSNPGQLVIERYW
ncbi:MAG: ferredoxin--NADP reductase [Planctomycetaceae bacterium]|nr:ferredoxin--NADP reductase [Planctomycetaceae bacterium]